MKLLLPAMILAWAHAVVAHAQPYCLPISSEGRHPLFGAISPRPNPEFTNGERTGVPPTSAAFGDLNGDGIVDAVTSLTGNGGYSYVTVMSGRGGGVFDQPVRYDGGVEQTFVELADMDADGIPDVLICNAGDGTISVMRGRGDGTLEEHVPYAAGDEPRSLVAADFNGDGHVDVAALNTVSSDVSILLNNGDGTLGPQTRIAVPNVTPKGNEHPIFPYPGPFIAAGDLNGDGHADLAVPATQRGHLLFNDGNGGFAPAPAHPGVPWPLVVYNVKLADLDGDGRLDIASSITAEDRSLMAVWLNLGGGEFAEADRYDSSWRGVGVFYFNTGLTIADLTRDGHPDIAVSSGEFCENVLLHRNLGDGTFGPFEILPMFRTPWFISSPDVDGDGAPDLVAMTKHIRGAMRVHLNDGEGNLLGPVWMPPRNRAPGPGERQAMDAADLDGDGDADLALGINHTSWFTHRVEILANDGRGGMERVREMVLDPDGESAVAAIVAADLNGDGLPELIVADTVVTSGFEDPGLLWVLENRGGMEFIPRVVHRFDDSFPRAVAVADFDGDGRPDVIAYHLEVYPGSDHIPVERRLMAFRNEGNLTLEPAAHILVGAAPLPHALGDVAVGDMTGDGRLEVAATLTTREATGETVVFRHDGTWSFSEVARRPSLSHPRSVAFVDFDDDGRDELAVLEANGLGDYGGRTPILSMFRLDGGELQLLDEHVRPWDARATTLLDADIDRDGQVDLVWGTDSGGIVVHLGHGDGTFDRGIRYDSLQSAFAVAVADFNGDGRPDIANTSIGSRDVSVQFNRSCYSPCPADLTGSASRADPAYGVPDLAVDVRDFFVFLDFFVASSPRADFTGDGTIDATDFFAFLDAFAAGCD